MESKRLQFIRKQASDTLELTKGFTPERRAAFSNELKTAEELASYILELTNNATGPRWVKASERLPEKGGKENSVVVRGFFKEPGYNEWPFVAYGYRNFNPDKQQIYFELGSKSYLTNDVEWLDESEMPANELPTFWDVAKAFKWATDYNNELGEKLVLTEDGQWLLLQQEDGVTETDELTPGNVAELYCLQKGFDRESAGESDAVDVDELWDEHAEYIDDNIDELVRWAGSTVVTREQFNKMMSKFKQQKEK